jgi:hypothetical protein
MSSTVAVPQVKVLPGRAMGHCPLFDDLPVNEHLDRPHVAREILRIRIGFGQGSRGNAGIILRGLWRAMPQPGLQLEQGHGLFGVVELAGNGGPGAMTGDAPACVVQRYPSFATERWDQTVVGPAALKLRYDLISLSPALTRVPF